MEDHKIACRAQGYRATHKALLFVVVLITISVTFHFQSIKVTLIIFFFFKKFWSELYTLFFCVCYKEMVVEKLPIHNRIMLKSEAFLNMQPFVLVGFSGIY